MRYFGLLQHYYNSLIYWLKILPEIKENYAGTKESRAMKWAARRII